MIITMEAFWADCLDLSFLREVKAAGFAGVDVGLEYKTLLDVCPPEERAVRVRENLEQVGLLCPQIHLPGHDYFTPSNAIEEDIYQHTIAALKDMPLLGAKWGAFHSLQACHCGWDHRQALQDNYRLLKEYLCVAEEYGVGIAIENIPRFPDCAQYDFFSSVPDEICELVDMLDSPYMGVCWDTSHNNLNLATPDKKNALERMGNRVRILHISSNFGNNDWHLCPAIGQVNWDDVLPVLIKNGYDGTFNIEVNKYARNFQSMAAYIHLCGQAAANLLATYGLAE